ncbi:cutinase transcription factor 1 beta [Fusarium albosuccineum]|uniref:Cutinase transcription factor 1 beta n=1 Tax=Fusarium albosuccineum TaxID=1237068 RepID=A0A8H4P8G3_9HYPO|nr:cutinase transcription factor 1 beta [Fusarium albosuccineum]
MVSPHSPRIPGLNSIRSGGSEHVRRSLSPLFSYEIGLGVTVSLISSSDLSIMKNAANARGRKRSTLACQGCHQRKVRCNVTQSGPPCVNCIGDGIKCEILARGGGLRRHRLVNILAPKEQHSPNNSIQNQETAELAPSSPPEASISIPMSPILRTPESVSEAVPYSESSVDTPTRRASEKQIDCDQQDQGDPGFSAILDDEGSHEETAFLYTGDQQGLGLVVDICKPNGRYRGNHFVIPRAAATNALLPEDLAALHAKNCFSLPSAEVQHQLLRCYFHHVHHFLPILDAAAFIQQYETGGPRKVNLLLLWSIFFSSTNFLDEETVTLAGYSSRKAMKTSLYRRAKALYDADYEKEKIPLTQSVLLLAFWYADSEDRDGPWHWIGIAISLCQTIGLHRNPLSERLGLRRALAQRRQTLSNDQCRLWRLIWWMCYFRDTWLSFGMGRPTRINLADCDMPMPTTEDVEAISAGISESHANKYLPKDESRIMPRLWMSLMETTFVLGGILNNHYRAKPLEDNPIAVISQDQRRLRQCRASFPTEDECDNSVLLSHLYHLHVYYEACTIALNRPYMASRPGQLVNKQEDNWKVQALQKAKIAASNINSTINNISASQMIDSCHAMMVTALIPALQIHLLESVSGDSVASGLHLLSVFESNERVGFVRAPAVCFIEGQSFKASSWNSTADTFRFINGRHNIEPTKYNHALCPYTDTHS